MAKKAEPFLGIKLWQALLGLVGSGIFIFAFAYQQISADVGQKRDIQEHEEALEKVDTTLAEHDQQIDQVDDQYRMLQQDLGYLKGQQQQILEAIKAKR